MVKINNQRKAFLDMLAWSEGADRARRQKTRNHGYDVIAGGRRAIYWLLRITSCKLVTLKPNSKSTGTGLFLYPLVGCLPQAAWPERLLSENQDAVALQQIKERSFYLRLIVVISVRQSTVAAISGLYCRALVMVSSKPGLAIRCKIQRSGRNGQRDWCMSRVTAIISALVICIIVCLSWAVSLPW